MGIDSGIIANWVPGGGVTQPSPAQQAVWEGMSATWQSGSVDGYYGGASQITAPSLTAYKTTGSTALCWWDQNYSTPTPIVLMPFNDSVADCAFAGDITLAGFTGGLCTLAAGQTYSVSTAVYAPNNVAGANLARFKLVTNTVTGSGGATTTYSPAITNDGSLAWSFSIPANAVTAYIAVEAMGTTPMYTTWFSKPVIYNVTNAYGPLSVGTVIPLRTLQVRMPPNYKAAGWPTAAVYLMDGAATLTYQWQAQANPVVPPTLTNGLPPQGATVGKSGAGGATQQSPLMATINPDIRFLAGVNYSASGGVTTWRPQAISATSPLGSMTFQSAKPPALITTGDTNVFTYKLGDQVLKVNTLRFTGKHGDFMYSDDLNGAGFTEYTVILVLRTSIIHGQSGGLWSSGVKAAGGGPDTSADITSINWRSVGLNGPVLTLESQGMRHANFPLDAQIQAHAPTYLALQFRNDYNRIFYAVNPQKVAMRYYGLGSTASGALNGSVVLGADANFGLQSGTFDLMEVNMYFRPMAAATIRSEIAHLGWVYG